MTRDKDPLESDSPILFAGISENYLRAFDIVWEAEFESKHPVYWDSFLILRPVSHLLGVEIENALKGLHLCKTGSRPWGHDLEKLFELVADTQLEESIDEALSDISVPKVIGQNSERDFLEEFANRYRSCRYHLLLLSLCYTDTLATRYPSLGRHKVPVPVALRIIAQHLLNSLNNAKRQWKPTRPGT